MRFAGGGAAVSVKSEKLSGGVRLARFGLAFAFGLGLSGCGGRPTGFLDPHAGFVAPPGAGRVDMLVATTRTSEGAAPGQMFTGERGPAAFADIAISIPPDAARQIGEVQWPSSLPGDPARDFVTVQADRLDGKAALARFDGRIARAPGRRVLLFVHGYNTRFEEAVYRFAQIIHDSRAPVAPVLFTWPSRGKLLAYAYDRESANYSRNAMEQLLQTLAKDRNVGEITILAHSMGNWVALEALHQMAVRNGRVSPKIANIVLAAPDVDFDVFRRDIEGLGADHPPITMFVSRDDKALAISRRLWGGVERAGAVDPRVEPYRSAFEKSRINVVDLTDVKSDDALNHSKFAESPEIVRLIGQRLAAGQTLNDGRASLGEKIGVFTAGAASTVGAAAGVVLSAPIAVVDADTRETLGDRAKDVGHGLGDTVTSATDIARR
jgi:esterase/lipase superfamily enzyme